MVATHSVNVAATHSTGHAYVGALLRRGWKGAGRMNDFVCGALYCQSQTVTLACVTLEPLVSPMCDLYLERYIEVSCAGLHEKLEVLLEVHLPLSFYLDRDVKGIEESNSSS